MKLLCKYAKFGTVCGLALIYDNERSAIDVVVWSSRYRRFEDVDHLYRQEFCSHKISLRPVDIWTNMLFMRCANLGRDWKDVRVTSIFSVANYDYNEASGIQHHSSVQNKKWQYCFVLQDGKHNNFPNAHKHAFEEPTIASAELSGTNKTWPRTSTLSTGNDRKRSKFGGVRKAQRHKQFSNESSDVFLHANVIVALKV